ncbi:PREDICTED: lysine-specific demethylase JMJ25-like [Camelina sativa]|uniref:Lysine-specific demethylase JMJ25-like n=1 Tax=Camelina sativa TaxID=90675 RepID=A0ABM0YWZ4_CAMSA|nr:PREDICTED: lysine-specific demethylase JMJ25-like [Camelina sativa]
MVTWSLPLLFFVSIYIHEPGLFLGACVTKSDITICQLDPSERISCNLCRTSIANFYRSCSHHRDTWEICLTCCKDLRKLSRASKISCPTKERGGCGSCLTLKLRRLCKNHWVKQLITDTEEVTLQFSAPYLDIGHECSLCTTNSGSIRRQATIRKNVHDNFLYSPNVVDLDEEDNTHFQSHWMRAEPVIVRNVFQKTWLCGGLVGNLFQNLIGNKRL